MAAKKGLIVYFDGPDGSGKTTQLQLAAKALQEAGHTVHETRTLGGTPIGELLRSASTSQHERPVETDLHIAIACQYALAPEVRSRRDKGEVVLIDRSPLSIMAYQVYGDGLEQEIGSRAANDIMDLIEPDMTILYQADSAALENRRHRRGTSHEYFESKPLEYHQRVADGYLKAAYLFKAEVLDALKDPKELHKETMALITHMLNA